MTPEAFETWLAAPPWRPLVMGVLNVTPDSFSDGGRFAGPGGPEAAAARAADAAVEMIAAGADLIDIGGESTRPGSQPVPEGEQVRRVVPVLNALRERLARPEGTASRSTGVPPVSSNSLSEDHRRDACATQVPDGRPPVTISIDTTRAAVAAAALDAGAHVVNDIWAGRDDPGMLPLVARRGVPVVLMHMQGTPATMQIAPQYEDVTREVADFLRDRLRAAAEAGVDPSRVLLDPGIGFGKAIAHNLELLRRLRELAGLGRPLLVGTSRKGFIGRITGAAKVPVHGDPTGRLFGTAATVAWAIANGAAVVRVHDVAPMSQVARMVGAIQFGVDP